MRASPGVRRAPVHRFADEVAARAPKRSIEQAVKHEVIPVESPDGEPITGMAELTDGLPVPNEFNIEEYGRERFEPSKAPAITLRPLTTEDVDQLWDWTREDAEGVTAFIGASYRNSRDLFKGIERVEYLQMENPPKAWIRTITRDASVIGFVIICPIQYPQGQPPVGTVHLYIAVPERGDLANIITGMLADFDEGHAPMTLSVIANRDWTAVLEPLGFLSQTVLTRPALTSSAHGS